MPYDLCVAPLHSHQLVIIILEEGNVVVCETIIDISQIMVYTISCFEDAVCSFFYIRKRKEMSHTTVCRVDFHYDWFLICHTHGQEVAVGVNLAARDGSDGVTFTVVILTPLPVPLSINSIDESVLCS